MRVEERDEGREYENKENMKRTYAREKRDLTNPDYMCQRWMSKRNKNQRIKVEV